MKCKVYQLQEKDEEPADRFRKIIPSKFIVAIVSNSQDQFGELTWRVSTLST